MGGLYYHSFGMPKDRHAERESFREGDRHGQLRISHDDIAWHFIFVCWPECHGGEAHGALLPWPLTTLHLSFAFALKFTLHLSFKL